MSDFPTINPATGAKWKKDELFELVVELDRELGNRTVLANRRMQTINTIHAWCWQTMYMFDYLKLEGTPGVSVTDIDHLIRSMHGEDGQ